MNDRDTATAEPPVAPPPDAVDSLVDRLAAGPGAGDGPDLSDARHRVRAALFGEASKARAARTIGRFTLLDRLGAGGMGEVFAAHDPELDRRVALKLVHRDRSDSEGARARLLREAQAMARLSHPNVVTVYESGTHDGRVYIAMELIGGADLRALFRERRPWRRVVAVYCDAARGLAAAHAVGLVHRDFKPENVMVGDDGRVRVLDFGLARASVERPAALPGVATLADVAAGSLATGDAVASGDHSDLLARSMTRTGVLVGTPVYMAPEQFLDGEATARSDQFSFCVALYESLYDRRPFVGATLLEQIEARRQGRVLAPPASDVPRAVYAVIRRGLRADPAARFPAMDALLAALERCLTGRKRVVQLLGLGGLTAGAVVAGTLLAAPVEGACAAGEAAIAAVWNPTRAAALADAFVRSGAPDGEALARRVADRVDRYAATWSRGQEGACAAAAIAGESARRLAELRTACLGDARRELDETLDVLASGEPEAALRGVQAIAALPDPERCGDSEALLAAVPPPDDPETAALVARARARASEARALRRAGLFARAHHEAERLAGSLTWIDYAPLRAEVELLRGQIAVDTAQYDVAAAQLERGFWAAVDSGHDEVAATAAVALAGVVGWRQAALESGLGWARAAEATIRRAHLPDALTVALRRSRARMLRVAGQPERARAELDAALAIARAPDDLDAVELLRDLAGVALDQGRPDEGAELAGRALAQARQVFGERHPEVGRALHLLGTALYGAGRREDARQTFAQALAIKEAVYGATHPDIGDTLNNLGATLDELGRDAEALAIYERALAIRRAHLGDDHPDVAGTLDNLSITLAKLGRLDEAEAALRRSQKILRAVHGERHPAIANNLLGLGNLARRRGDLEAAIERTREAAAMLLATLGPDHPDLGYAQLQLAELLIESGAPAAAIEPARRALALRTRPDEDPLLVAEARLRLGQALWLAGRERDEARALLREARAGHAAHAPPEQLAGLDAWLASHKVALDGAAEQ